MEHTGDKLGRKDAQDLVTGGIWGVRGDQVSQAVSTSCPPNEHPGLTWATGLADIAPFADGPTVLHPKSALLMVASVPGSQKSSGEAGVWGASLQGKG